MIRQQRIIDLARIVLLVLLALLPAAYWIYPRIPPLTIEARASAGKHKINPNIDPWWMLAALPNIGVNRAKEIVNYRINSSGDHPFTCPADLQLVPGIGPFVLQQSTTHLDFRPLTDKRN